MSEGRWGIAWGQVLVTAVLSFGVSVAFYHYSARAPELVYEVFPPAHFTSQAAETSIYNVRVENVGNKEATDVQVYLALPAQTQIQDVKVEPSSAAIRYEILRDERRPQGLETRLPLLNAGESVRFSLLTNRGAEASLTVETRGAGVVGISKSAEDNTMKRVNGILQPIAMALSAAAVLLAVFSKFDQLQRAFQDYFGQQLRATRSLSSSPAAPAKQPSMETVLRGNAWRLFYNPSAVPPRSKVIRFGEGGHLLEGGNKNENTWRINNDLLELVNSEGGVHGRFYYSPADGRFYSTNDPDIGAIIKHRIQDQYLAIDAQPVQKV